MISRGGDLCIETAAGKKGGDQLREKLKDMNPMNQYQEVRSRDLGGFLEKMWQKKTKTASVRGSLGPQEGK